MRYFLHDMKLKYKFMITNMILVLVPTIVLFVFLYGRLSHIIEVNAIESERAIVNQTASTLEATANQIIYVMDNITSSPFLSRAIYSPDFAEYLTDMQSSEEAREFYDNIHNIVDHEFIKAVRIYIPEQEGMEEDYGDSGIIEPVTEVKGSHWHGIFDGSPKTMSLVCPSFYLTSSEIPNLGDMAYIRKFPNAANREENCVYVAIYFSREHLQNILHQNLTSMNSVYYIINSRDCIVAASSPVLAGTYFMSYDTIQQTIGDTQEFTMGRILNESLYMGYREIGQTDWRLVSIIPEDSVFTESQRVLINTMGFYLIFAVLACSVALILSTNIARRLSKVVEKMNLYRDKMPVKFENNEDQDEIGQLVENYNIMVERINDLMTEQTKTAEKLKVSEVKALQAQINPHFLYNMLDMINWLAKSGQQEKVSEAIQTLSKFYKLTLSKKNITIPVGEELRHVSLYAMLQNMRFENKIEFIIDVPDEIMEYEIPKLVLQPIVENAILHGIFEKESKSGNIVIMAWMEGGDIVFTVSDTGMGIPPERLETILDGTEESEHGSNIGIYNTHMRLRYLYGETYGLHYESDYGQGTEVQVRIPAIRYSVS